MKSLKVIQPLHAFALVGAIAVAACFTAGAQTTTTAPVKKLPVPIRTAKPAPQAAPAKAAVQKTQSASPILTPASSQTVLTPASQGAVAPATSAPGLTAPSNMMNGMSAAGSSAASNAITGLTSAGSSAASQALTGQTSAGATGASNALTGQTSAGGSSYGSAGNSRAPVGGLGVGSFVGRGWTLVAYGCYRSSTRLFCDCDTSYQSNLQAGSNIWGPVKLVDDGGKITERHNAFFVGDDGSQFPTAYLTPTKPVRFMMEYDNIDQRYTSITLVLGQQQIQGVPITLMDPNQALGTMPARPSANGAAPGTNGTSR